MKEEGRLLERVRKVMSDVKDVEEKKMFRGVTFMVDGKMCISVNSEGLMCRVDPAIHDELVEEPGVTSVLMRGNVYRSFVYVDEEVVTAAPALKRWVELCLDYNPLAKASKKKAARKK